MNAIKPFAILALVLLLFSCGDLKRKIEDLSAGSVELQQFSSSDGKYSLGIPTYMTKSTSLNESASLQFQNLFKEAYVIVIDEDKQEFIDAFINIDQYDTALTPVSNYANVQIQSICDAMQEVTSKSEIKKFKIEGLKAASIEIEGSVSDVDVAYFLTFVEGKDDVFMTMAWTLKDKKDTHRATFEKVAKSFKLLR